VAVLPANPLVPPAGCHQAVMSGVAGLSSSGCHFDKAAWRFGHCER